VWELAYRTGGSDVEMFKQVLAEIVLVRIADEHVLSNITMEKMKLSSLWVKTT